MEHSSINNSRPVLDHDAFHLHKKDSHGFLVLVCSGLVGCCWFEVVTSIPI